MSGNYFNLVVEPYNIVFSVHPIGLGNDENNALVGSNGHFDIEIHLALRGLEGMKIVKIASPSTWFTVRSPLFRHTSTKGTSCRGDRREGLCDIYNHMDLCTFAVFLSCKSSRQASLPVCSPSLRRSSPRSHFWVCVCF